MTKQVNGPINCVRLEGKVGKINKVIYLYFDWHKDVERQTRCEDIRAVDFKKYLTEEFDKLDKKLDFFLEINPSMVTLDSHRYKQKYIWEVSEMFTRIFNYDPKKRKVLQSKDFPNVRFHYFDIRDYIEWDTGKIMRNMKDYIYENMWHSNRINVHNLNEVLDGLLMMCANLFKIYDFLFEGRKIKKVNKPIIPENAKVLSKYTQEEKLMIGLKYLNKVLSKFNHKEVKDAINNYVNKELSVHFTVLFNLINNYKKYIEKVMTDVKKINPDGLYCANNDIVVGMEHDKLIGISANLVNGIEHIEKKYMHCFSYLTDLVSFRRFLDKDYIKNCVLYSGAFHSTHHIYFLVKYFDFKITHYSHGPFNKDLIKNIKKSKIITDSNVLCQFYGDEVIQCTDMSSFPEKFT